MEGAKGAAPAYGWVVTIVVWLTGISMPLNMLKVSILAPVIMEAFSVDTDAMSWVIATFYIMGMILALPGAVVVDRIGKKATFVLSLVCALIGGALGYIAQDIGLFIVSRIIEGIGFGLVTTAAVPAISAWFAPEHRGVPLGVWAINVTAAFLIGPNLFSQIYAATGSYHDVWALSFVFDAVVLIAVLVLYREPTFTFDDHGQRVALADGSTRASAPKKGVLKRVLTQPAVLLVAAIFFCEEVPFLGMSNFLTTYAAQETDLTLPVISTIISVMAIVGCVVNPLSGMVSDKIKSNKKLMVISCIGGTVYAWLVFQATTVQAFIPVILCNALAGGIIPTMVMASIPKVVKDPGDIAGATAVVLFAQQLASFLGSRVLGLIVATYGSFAVAGQFFMAPIFALGLVVLVLGWKKLP